MQLFSKDAFAFREQFQNLKKVQSICLCGLFVAAYVALSFFSIKMTEFLEFRFAFLALAAAAACGGPVPVSAPSRRAPRRRSLRKNSQLSIPNS